MKENIGVLVETAPGPGILHKLTGVIAQHDANITSVDIIEEYLIYFEIDVTDGAAVIDDMSELSVVRCGVSTSWYDPCSRTFIRLGYYTAGNTIEERLKKSLKG